MTASKIIAAFLLLCVLGSGPVLGQVSCPGDFSAIDGKCFQIVTETMDWAAAQANCEALGGYLAILDDCRVWVDVVKTIEEQDIWIGATDIAEEGDWLWFNGESVEMGIPFWGSTEQDPEPNEGTAANCAFVSAEDQYYFHDGACDSLFGSVCQVASTLLMT